MPVKEKLKLLPQKPGIYMMFDSLGNIIYVGKAKNLKNRVSQYFHKQKDRSPKVTEMVQNINRFDFKIADTELDAFIEESRLIKEIQPKYNRQMKNYRNYVYLKIPVEEFPKIIKVHDKIDDGAIYFGPFTSLNRVEATLKYLNTFYPIRKCASPKLVRRANGCLFRQLGTCLGVCTGQVSPEEYKLYIEKIRLFLTGNDVEVMQELSKKLDIATIGLTQFDIDEAQILYSYLKKNRKRVKSFWIPSTRLNSENSLELTVVKIVDKLQPNISKSP